MFDESQLSLFRRLIASPSPSGFEQPIQAVIREAVDMFTDEVRTDVHGNVIATLNPAGRPRVMLTAHCDELGFLIRYIDEQGFLYFAPIGGYDPSTLPGERVQIQGPDGLVLGVIGRKPVHSLEHDEREKAPKMKDLWIDIGASGREEAQKRAPVGSIATRAAQLETLHGDLVVSRALDDKSGIFAVLEATRRISEQRERLKASVSFVSAVQEEVGSRGAVTSAYSVEPDIAIAVDVTPTTDHPMTSKQEMGEVKINGGPVITIGGFINPRVYQLLVSVTKEAGLAYQVDPQSAYTWTDTDNIQVARSGVATGLVSIPCRYLHTGSEIVSLKDVDQVATVLANFVLALEKETNIIP
jgi:endoglucanase